MAPVETDSLNESRKLILCFDGTGNSFTGSGSDTNVVKLLRMLDRNDKHQYHYYQTGIGTYDVDDTSVNKGWAGEMRSNISQKIDMGFGTTFDAHVIAGYRFLMRYYETGDRIYIFGFSRGAFTARFLARMVNTVGLLCKGNEEMVPFAYKLYQNHLANVKKSEKNSEGGATNTSDVPVAQVTKANTNGTYGTMETPVSPPDTPINEAFPNAVTSPGDVSPKSTGRKVRRGKRNEIEAFSKTFCRKEESDHGKDNIKVFFLGMWDCVNSVKVLEQAGDKPASVKGTATFVRHAVAVDEFRVKFKPALLAQDVTKISRKRHNHVEDIKEVWFPGNHGDVGGGWSAIKDDPTWKAKEAQRIKAQRLEDEEVGTDEHNYPLDKPTIWGRFLRLIGLGEEEEEEEIDDTEEMQLSDIPLSWMIRELELADQEYEKKTGKTGLKWRPRRLNRFKESIYQNEEKQTQALKGWIHDLLRFGNGMGYFKPLMWYLLEFCPLIKRWELDDKNGGWALTTFPLNGGGPRDIPRNAILHESLHRRLHNDVDYQPQNNHGNLKEACLRKNREHYDPHTTHEGDCAESCFHNTWKFKAHGTGADHVESLATS